VSRISYPTSGAEHTTAWFTASRSISNRARACVFVIVGGATHSCLCWERLPRVLHPAASPVERCS